MKHLTPQVIAGITGGAYVGRESARDIRVAGAARDNRDIKPGSLFICVAGARVDGHSFANSAFDAGASCCLAERPIPEAKGPYVLVGSTLESIKTIAAYHRSLFSIPVIGITGSVGKTTAKELTAAVLGAKYKVLKTEENLNNELGVPLTLMSIGESHEVAVIEMGISDFGEMSRLAQIVRPDIFVITNIGYSHLKELGDLEGVLRAKTEAFEYMSPNGVAVLNGDDEMLLRFDPGIRKITFGLGAHNDFYADNVRWQGAEAVLFDLHGDMGSFPACIPAYGSHLPSLAPAAAAIGRLLGLGGEEISRGFLSYSPVSGRANIINTGNITLIDDCYNANPNSVRAALSSLKTLPGRRTAILGDMINLGAESELLHREVGLFAAKSGLSGLICCGREASFIYDGYVSAGGGGAYYYPDKSELIPALPEHIKKGGAVLVKASRGMHFEEIVESLKKSTGFHNGCPV